MRVIARTEAAARKMLQDRVNQGIMTEKDAERLFRYAFSTVVATIANWRRREFTNEMIEAHIKRRITAARLALAHASTASKKSLAARELITAQMFAAVWQGMQDDATAYSAR